MTMREFSILIVDEDVDSQKQISEQLNREDRKLYVTACTTEAQRIMSDQPIDMIILDTGKGAQCGFGFMQRAFNRSEPPSIPVFMMSVRNDLATKIRSYMSGALRFFSKPIDIDELISSIERFEIRKKQCFAQ